MSNDKCPQEFKDEVVRQVVINGYSVTDVARYAGMSDQSLLFASQG